MKTPTMYLIEKFEFDNPWSKHTPVCIINDAATANTVVAQLVKEEYKSAADEGRAVFYGYCKTAVLNTTELWKR